MTNSNSWDPWTPEGCLTDLPPNSQLAALGAAIGKYARGGPIKPESRLVGEMATDYADHPAHRPPANDNRPLMIGITGKRNVGKSTVASLLECKFGFSRAHAFDGGKEAALHYFAHVTGDIHLANRMVYGDLKDQPSPHLPGNVAPRFFLEKFGHFMGATMGVEWTLAMEIARVRRESPRSPIVVESLVYEAPWFQAAGGYVLRLERPEHDGPEGIASDSVQAGIVADAIISARSVAA